MILRILSLVAIVAATPAPFFRQCEDLAFREACLHLTPQRGICLWNPDHNKCAYFDHCNEHWNVSRLVDYEFGSPRPCVHVNQKFIDDFVSFQDSTDLQLSVIGINVILCFIGLFCCKN